MSRSGIPFHPGEYLADAMEVRGWNTADLALRMGTEGTEEEYGVNYLAVDLLLHVRIVGAHVGQDMAEGLGRAFGTSADVWLNLDRSWHEDMKRLEN